jgi:hypothetical protein
LGKLCFDKEIDDGHKGEGLTKGMIRQGLGLGDEAAAAAAGSSQQTVSCWLMRKAAASRGIVSLFCLMPDCFM